MESVLSEIVYNFDLKIIVITKYRNHVCSHMYAYIRFIIEEGNPNVCLKILKLNILNPNNI